MGHLWGGPTHSACLPSCPVRRTRTANLLAVAGRRRTWPRGHIVIPTWIVQHVNRVGQVRMRPELDHVVVAAGEARHVSADRPPSALVPAARANGLESGSRMDGFLQRCRSRSRRRRRRHGDREVLAWGRRLGDGRPWLLRHRRPHSIGWSRTPACRRRLRQAGMRPSAAEACRASCAGGPQRFLRLPHRGRAGVVTG